MCNSYKQDTEDNNNSSASMNSSSSSQDSSSSVPTKKKFKKKKHDFSTTSKSASRLKPSVWVSELVPTNSIRNLPVVDHIKQQWAGIEQRPDGHV